METLWAGVQEQARLWRLGTLLPLILGCFSERKQVQQQVRGTGTTHTCGNAPPPEQTLPFGGRHNVGVCVCYILHTNLNVAARILALAANMQKSSKQVQKINITDRCWIGGALGGGSLHL